MGLETGMEREWGWKREWGQEWDGQYQEDLSDNETDSIQWTCRTETDRVRWMCHIARQTVLDRRVRQRQTSSDTCAGHRRRVPDGHVRQGIEQHQPDISNRDIWRWTSVDEIEESEETEETEEMEVRLIF